MYYFYFLQKVLASNSPLVTFADPESTNFDDTLSSIAARLQHTNEQLSGSASMSGSSSPLEKDLNSIAAMLQRFAFACV